MNPVKYVGNVAGGIGQGISSLLNTPNCYYAMSMMFYVMFFRIRPLQPHEGGYLGDYDYQEKSTILDTGIIYTHRNTMNAKRYVKSVVQDARTNPFNMKVVFNKKGDFDKYRIRTKVLTDEEENKLTAQEIDDLRLLSAQSYGRDSDTISTGSERLSNDSTTGYQQLSTIDDSMIQEE